MPLIWILFWLGGLFATAVIADTAVPADGAPPDQISLDYEVRARGVPVGDAQWLIEPLKDGRRRFRVEIKSKGFVDFFYPVNTVSESIWRYQPERGIVPLTYRYTHSRREKRNLQVDFDWSRDVAEVVFRGNKRQEPLSEDTFDNQLFLLELGRRAAAGEDPIRFKTISNKDLKEREAEVVGRQTLEGATGKIDTLRLIYADDDKRVTVWYSPSHYYLPLMIEYYDLAGGERLLLTGISLKAAGQPRRELAIQPLDGGDENNIKAHAAKTP